MNARTAFSRSEAVLDYRPVPTHDGTYDWHWVLLALPHETHLGSGKAPNRAQASAQARLKARLAGRRISKVRIAGVRQEAKIVPTAKQVIAEATDPKEFIEKQPPLESFAVVYQNTKGERLYMGQHRWKSDPRKAWALSREDAERIAAFKRNDYRNGEVIAVDLSTVPGWVKEAVDTGVSPKDFIEQMPRHWEDRLQDMAKFYQGGNVATNLPARYKLVKRWKSGGEVVVYLNVFTKAATQSGTICKIEVDYLPAKCIDCGHSREDHESDEGVEACWHGSGSDNRCACYQYKNELDWKDEEHWYGDMNVFVDKLEPIWAQVTAHPTTPSRVQVRQWFNPLFSWLYENPGEVKI